MTEDQVVKALGALAHPVRLQVFRAMVTTGPAGTALIEVASERKAGLIVVGTIGRTGLRRALLGSVAETVAKGASSSVLIVRRHPA